MSLKKYKPLSPDPFVNKTKGDTEFARLAHLNDLVNKINAMEPSGLTPGAVLYANANGVPITGVNLFWNETSNRLGVNTITPTSSLHVVGTTKVVTTDTTIDIQSGDDAINGVVNKNTFVRYTLTNSSTGISSAAGCLFYNDVNAVLQMFQASSGNSNNPNKAVIRGSGAALVMLSTGYLQFNTGSGYGTEKMRLHNSGSVSLGTSTESTAAKLRIDSTSKGFLPPRMTGAQVEAIASPDEGLMVYSTDGSGTTITSKGWWGYNGTIWEKLN